MTLEMAITVLKMDKTLTGFNPAGNGNMSNNESLAYEAKCAAIDAMEELKRYQEIGTVEEYREVTRVAKQKKQRWIPVTEALPVVETEVLVLTRNSTITTGIYEDGTVAEADSTWYWEASGEWIESYGCYVIPAGWFEYKHYSHEGCCLNCAVEDEVIAWMPLPMIYERDTEGKMKLIDAELLKSRLSKRIRTKRSTMEILKDIFPIIDNMPSVKPDSDELQEYREIGTAQECREAVEKLRKLRDLVKNY